MTEKKINYQFKLLYALGIIFIVAGHCANNSNGGMSLFYDWFPPYAFHLALFVFCSGYFYQKDNEKNVMKSILHKIKTLLVPLYLWNLFYGLFVELLVRLGFTIGERMSLYNLLIAPWTDGHQFEFNMGSWFIAPLFMVYVINLLVRKVLSLLSLDNDFLICVLYLLIGMYGIHLAMGAQNEGFYLIFVRVAYFIPFYGLGILYRQHLEKRDRLPNLLYFAIVLIAQLATTSYYGEVKSYIPSWGQGYDSIFTPFLIAVLGIAFWLRIARLLAPLCENSRCIMLLANNTYSIMMNHFLGFFCVNVIYAFLSTKLSPFEGFDIGGFHSSVWYSYLPFSAQGWYTVYLVAGLIVPVLISLGLQFIKEKCVNLLSSKQ